MPLGICVSRLVLCVPGLTRSGQLAMRETLKRLLTHVDWNAEGIASRFFPVIELVPQPGSDRIILLDPSIQFGKPVSAGQNLTRQQMADLFVNVLEKLEKRTQGN
ncbi:hypothetical protein [Egbenema bharatensis]|uniref:hypothetical protein n=1 Tax=Egbenema bharatensis TaxID=3463334 RepID=UPI003A856917